MAATSMSHIRKHRPLDGLQESFTSIEDLENALDRFKYQINRSNFAPTMESIFDDTLKVELLLLSMDESFLHTLSPQLFPVDPSQFYSSLGGKLLQRLSTFFLCSPLVTLSGESQSTMKRHYHLIEAGPDLITDLLSMAQSMSPVKTPTSSRLKQKRQQRSGTNSRHHAEHFPFDAQAFCKFDIEVPQTQDTANDALACTTDKLRSLLTYYLDNLRLPHIASAIKSSFIPEVSSPICQSCPSTVASEAIDDIPISGNYGDETPVVSKGAQIMSYFNNVKGFGEWKILISTRAHKDLRDVRRQDCKMFGIVMKKMRELSNGHFSHDNQKRLNGYDQAIPIFEAKMTRDTRLIYQVDCVPEGDGQFERQVLRIFGVYTHAQLHRPRFWVSLGHHLFERHGKSYRDKCIFRRRPKGAIDSDVYIPELFPPQEVPISLDSHLELPRDDLNEIHSLMVLEKYLSFSEEVLKSIVADVSDATFPFEVSTREQSIIQYPHSCYVIGRSGTGKTITMLFKMLWIEQTSRLNWADVKKPRQLFVTKSRILARKAEEYFTKLLDTLAMSSKPLEEWRNAVQRRSSTKEDALKMISVDDEALWRNDLPSKFSDLQDSHFPLFLTFDHLCSLLFADITEAEHGKSPKSQKFISFDTFLVEYWLHFPQLLTKQLDPVLVFNELMGVILGSEQSLASPEGYLDRAAYESLSHRTQSTFANQRSTIYNIFEAYLDRKRCRGEMDFADRTRRILQHLTHNFIPQKLDYIYVDEAQDNLLIDALLLRSLCHSANGLFWAGDTAQTISSGCSFRFNDLKSFMFRVEQEARKTTPSTVLAYGSQTPKTFFLETNYRSHSGIVRCAHSIIEIITKLWPYSIDELGHEIGVVDGQKPVFLSKWDDDHVRSGYEQFLFGSSQKRVEFGARQCILVRDDSARDKLRQQVGDIGIIMTLYESKGLEFDDVLLFNFFDDSSVDAARWRVVLTVESDLRDEQIGLPRFSERHTRVCLELKNLYVAITRARKNLWIADCSDRCEPVKRLWSRNGFIQIYTPDMDIPQLGTTSSQEEWANMAEELFKRKKFLQATHCYERASMQEEAIVSSAYQLRETALRQQVRKSSIREQKQAYSEAADAFIKAAAAMRLNRTAYFKAAGECFELACKYEDAIHSFTQGENFDSAAKIYRELGRFDDAIALIRKHEHDMEPDLVKGIMFTARLDYFRKGEIDKGRRLFSSYEEVFKFLEDHDLALVHASILNSLKRHHEAAELYLKEERTMEAICELQLAHEQHNRKSSELLAHIILQELWSHQAIGTYPNKNLKVEKMLSVIDLLKDTEPDSNVAREMTMFEALYAGRLSEVMHLAETFWASSNFPAAYLCLDLYFSPFPDVHGLDCHELSRVLELFLRYTRVLYRLAFQPDDSLIVSLCKIFGFRAVSEGVYVIPSGTRFRSIQHVPGRSRKDAVVTADQLLEMCRSMLRFRLRQKVEEESEKCRTCRAFDPCLSYAFFGNCSKEHCSQDHDDSSATPAEWYIARVRLHVQQVLVIQTLHADADFGWNYRLRWIRLFYSALYPSYYTLGGPTCLALSSEYQDAIRILADWARGQVYRFHLENDHSLLSASICTALIALTYDKEKAMSCLIPPQRTPFPPSVLPPPAYFPRGNMQQKSLLAAISALCAIISSKIPVDVSILCDSIDFTCSSIIFNYAYYYWYWGSSHRKTVPLSWLLLHLRQPVGFTHHGDGCHYGFVQSMKVLLKRIYTVTEAEHLLFRNGDLSTNPSERHGFIARICRAICILGINVDDPRLRSLIECALKSLRGISRRPLPLYGQYVFARGWEGITVAIYQSMKNHPLDEMVRLVWKPDLPASNRPFIRNIVYETEDQLLHDLQSNIDIQLDESKLDLVQSTKDAVPEEPISDIHGGDTAADSGEIEKPEALDETHMVEEPEKDILETFTAGDIELIKKVQQRYAGKLRRRREPASMSRNDALYAEFTRKAQQQSWAPRSSYRLLFLGPLPLILRCLNVVTEITLAQKNHAKKRFHQVSPGLLNSIDERRTQLSKLYNKLIDLRNTLKPDSDFHTRFDVAELKKQVQRVDEEFKNLPFAMPEEIQEDLELGLKAIVQPRRKVRGKPSLVWDDDETTYADKFM